MKVERFLGHFSQKTVSGSDGLSRGFTAAGRVLLALMLTLVLVMPWSESLCHFDQFLRGGQDLELGLLALATLLCLVLVLLQHCGLGVRLLLAMRKWLSLLLKIDVAWNALDGNERGRRDEVCLRAEGCWDGSFVPLRI